MNSGFFYSAIIRLLHLSLSIYFVNSRRKKFMLSSQAIDVTVMWNLFSFRFLKLLIQLKIIKSKNIGIFILKVFTK